jgi:hypothetical protein
MPYIGRPLNAGNLAVQSGTGDGSDTTPIATLDYSVGSSNSIGVYLDGVRQLAGTDFTASGTVLTFTTAPANGVGIDVYFLGLELSIPTPADASVSTAKIIDDAVTLAKMATGTDGNIISYDASGNPVAIATGSDGQVLTSAGAGQPCAFETLSAGKVLQVVNTTITAKVTGTTTAPQDDTKMQITEGVATTLIRAITPSSASNKLKIDMVLVGVEHSAAASNLVCGLFQDSTASCLASMIFILSATASRPGSIAFSHYMAAGTTSSTSFSVRLGSGIAGTSRMNAWVGGNASDGTSSSSITITEIAV